MRRTAAVAVALIASGLLTSTGSAASPAPPPDPTSTVHVDVPPGKQAPPEAFNWLQPLSLPGVPSSTATHLQVKPPGAAFQFTFREPVNPGLKAVFAEAGRRWGAVLSSTVPIQVVARQLTFAPDPGAAASGIFPPTGSVAGARPDTRYPGSLANAISRQDNVPPGTLTPALECTLIGCEILVTILGPDSAFYYGLDGRPSPTQVDALSLVEHELGHGLGFAGGNVVINPDGTATRDFDITIYDRFLLDKRTGRTYADLASPSQELRQASEGPTGNLVLNGRALLKAFGRPVPVFTPTPYSQGDSISHTSSRTLPHSVMNTGVEPGTPFFGAVNRIDAPTVGILADLGWPIRDFLLDKGKGHGKDKPKNAKK